jgi:hypothetical protein
VAFHVPDICQTACDDRLKAGPLREIGQPPGFGRNREKLSSFQFRINSVLSATARVMAELFIGMVRLLEIIRLTKCNTGLC